MKKILVLAALAMMVLMVSTPAVAADVSGTWKVEAPQGGPGGGGGGGGRGMGGAQTFVLKQDGAKLTGKVVINRGDTPMENEILNGKVDGDNISFEVKMAGPQGESITTYKAKVTGTKMEGTRERQGSTRGPSAFTATKQ